MLALNFARKKDFFSDLLVRQSETPEAKLRRLKRCPRKAKCIPAAGNRNKLYENSLEINGDEHFSFFRIKLINMKFRVASMCGHLTPAENKCL